MIILCRAGSAILDISIILERAATDADAAAFASQLIDYVEDKGGLELDGYGVVQLVENPVFYVANDDGEKVPGLFFYYLPL